VFHDPIVYLSDSGKYEVSFGMTDLNHQKSITIGKPSESAKMSWSPDGSRLLINGDLVESGKALVDLTLPRTEEDDNPFNSYYFTSTASWLPDGSGFAYITGESDDSQLNVVKLGSYTPTTIYSWPELRCSADGFLPDELLLTISERAYPYLKPTIYTTPYGILLWVAPNAYARECLNDGFPEILSVTMSGEILWAHSSSPDILHISGDGKTALFVYADRSVMLVDLATGMETQARTLVNKDIVGLNEDGTQAFYATSKGKWVSPNLENELFELIRPYFYTIRQEGFDGVTTLWQVPVDGSTTPRKLYQRAGYTVGRLRTIPDRHMIVFSVVVGNGALINAINRNMSISMLNKLSTAYVDIVALSLEPDNNQVLWTIQGRQFELGKGEFVVVVPE
jgi:hypothetical protein